MTSLLARGFLLLLLGTACTRDPDETPGDSGRPPADAVSDATSDAVFDAEAPDAGPPLPCGELAAGERVPIADPEAGELWFSEAAWADPGVALLWQGADRLGFRLGLLGPDGTLGAPIHTLWGDRPGAQQPALAVSGGVAAVAFLTEPVDSTSPPACQLGVARLSGESVRAPLPVGTPREPEKFLEVSGCEVVAGGPGFVVVWVEMVAEGEDLVTRLFAQRFDLAGAPVGERLDLVRMVDKRLRDAFSVASDGARVFIAHVDADNRPVLTTLDGAEVTSSPLPEAGRIEWAGGLVLRTASHLTAIDADGRVVAGPVPAPEGAIPALVEGFPVLAWRDEFPLVQRLGPDLSLAGGPLGLSIERSARLHRIASAPVGPGTLALVFDGGRLWASPLRCGETRPPEPGPTACPEVADAGVLDDGCTDEVCYAVVRLDYPTLGLKGFATIGAPYAPADEAAARAAAEAVFARQELLGGEPPTLVPPAAGLYEAHVSPGDFGGFCLIGSESGLTVACGGVVWAGRGDFWVPEAWRETAALRCGADTEAPSDAHVVPGGCDADGVPGRHTIEEALDLALRTNLAASFAARGAFSAYAMLYTPTVGACDPGVAEFLVVFSQRPPA